MNAVLQALGDPTIRGWYVVFCFAVLILPMVALTSWYHTRIRCSRGGRKLMERQGARPNLADATSMMRDIASGRYGEAARTMQSKVYLFILCWIAANAVAFGLLIWADEVNRVPAS